MLVASARLCGSSPKPPKLARVAARAAAARSSGGASAAACGRLRGCAGRLRSEVDAADGDETLAEHRAVAGDEVAAGLQHADLEALEQPLAVGVAQRLERQGVERAVGARKSVVASPDAAAAGRSGRRSPRARPHRRAGPGWRRSASIMARCTSTSGSTSPRSTSVGAVSGVSTTASRRVGRSCPARSRRGRRTDTRRARSPAAARAHLARPGRLHRLEAVECRRLCAQLGLGCLERFAQASFSAAGIAGSKATFESAPRVRKTAAMVSVSAGSRLSRARLFST